MAKHQPEQAHYINVDDDLRDVQEQLIAVSHKWYDIGLHLNVKPSVLNRIRSQYSNPTECLREMLSEWLSGINPYPTWEALAQALESLTVGESQLAMNLRERYLVTAPQLRDAEEQLVAVSHKWYDIGLHLNVKPSVLNRIRSQYSNPTECLREMLSEGLSGINPYPTWEALAQALESLTVGECRLAMNLREKYHVTAPPTPMDLTPEMDITPSHRPDPTPPQPDPKLPRAPRPTYHPPTQRPLHHPPLPPYIPAPQMHPVDQYAKYLRAYYRRGKLPIHSKWPPTASKKYIHLAVVKKEGISKQQADEFTRATLHGNIEDIVRRKESLDFSGIGKKDDGSPAQFILVEGGPGIGKTTFAWEVCRKWSKGEILRRYRLVVLLRLRDKRVREARSICDLLYYSDDEVRREIAKEVTRSNGESVLLLYEGYDELPGKLQTQQSIFLDILYQECLPEATVLITSRPSATQFLCRQFKKSMDQHIEILGFTKADVHTYVLSVIRDQQLHTEFTQYLKCYPHIRGLMYVPLNAVIVSEIYKTTKLDKSQEFVPTTLTELYTSLTRGMLLRYLASHNEYGKQEWKLSSFSDLPAELHKQFYAICGIAFQGILRDEFIFDDLARDFNTLDLMQSASELYVDQGAVVSHNFFHLTLQEFLAAVHVSQQPTEKQLQYFLQSAMSWKELQVPPSTSSLTTQDREPMTSHVTSESSLPYEVLTSSHFQNVLKSTSLTTQDQGRLEPLQAPMTSRPTSESETSTLPRPRLVPELQLAEGTLLPRQGTPQALQTTPSLTTQDQGRLEPLQAPMTSRPTSESTPPRPEAPAIPDTADIGRLLLETPQLEPLVPQQLLSQREVPPMTNPRPVIPHTLPFLPPTGSLPYAALTSSHFQNVLKFTAGLTKLKKLPTASLESILLQDQGDKQGIPLYSLHWLFEAQCISTYSKMIGETTTLTFDHTHSSMNPFDCFVLGFALSHINTVWNINLWGSRIGDEGLEMLVAGMNYKEATLPPSLKSVGLNLGYCDISSVGLSHFKEMPEQVATRITLLELFGNRDISTSLLTNVTSRMPLLHSNKLKELIRNEMQQGYVSADLTTCLASGPPGVGKSTLECLLFGQLPPEIRISTACIEQAERAVITYQDSDISKGNEWKKVTAGILKSMCAEQMKASSSQKEAIPDQSQKDAPIAVTSTPGQEDTPTLGQDDAPTPVKEDTPTAVTPTPGQQDTAIGGTPVEPVQIMDSIRDRQSSDNKDSGKTSLLIQHKPQISDWVMPSETDEILKLMETSPGFRQLLDVHWVHFIDSGGQEEFLQILPAFVRNISLQMLIFKLSEQLRSIPTVEYYNKDGKGYEIGHFTLTNEEMLLKAAKMSLFHQSEVSLPYSDMVSDYPEPKIIVVGTFKDQVNTTEGIHKKNDRLRDVLKPYKDHLIPRSEKEIIYPVNARLAGQGDKEDPVASELRHAIERYSPRLKMKIPLRWYLLELELRKLGLVLSKSRCWEIAQRLQFESKETLEVALQYLHEANLFLYYPDILDSVVFVNSKALLDVITQLFELHIDMRGRDECDIISDDDLRFRKQAIFSARTLSDCSTKAEYDKKVLPDEDLAKLLQHRLIIADISTEVPERKYFMPSLLPVHENLQDCRPCETAADPLHIIFPEDCTPNGLFCAMQVQLLSRNHSLQWRIITLQPTDQIHKNCIQFSISDSIGDDSIIITAINVNTHFEMHPHAACPPDILPHILRCIDESLHKACATFSYKTLHEFAFSCVCGKAPPHSAVFVQEGLTKTCVMNPREPEPLSSKQIPWVSTTKEKGVTSSPPLPPLLPHHRRDPRFPGIMFYGDPILKVVDSDGCKLARPEIGICIHFPPKAVPDGKALHLTIWPCLSGPFVPPEGREFSSPVYMISPAFQFQEDVELSISHFENLRCEEDIASMSFATTLSSTDIHKSKPVYMFEPLEKGEFKVTSSVGTINLRHFCRDTFCQVAATRKRQRSHSQDDEPEAERAPKEMKEEYYCVQLHYSPGLAVFAVSLYQDLYLKNLESNLNSQFPNHHFFVRSKQPVYLSGDAVELVIPEIQGWSIDPSIDPTKISQKEVDLALIDPNCDSLPASYPPRLLVTITPSAQAADGKCVLYVKGIQEEFSWSIRLTASGSSLATVPNTMQQLPQGATASKVNPSTNKAKASESPLTINDRPKVMKYLRRISNVQTLLMVGESLGLDGTKLALKVTTVTFLFDLVGDWLSRTHTVDEKGMPSWRKLIEVLEEVDETGLASDIRKDLGFN